MGIFKKITTVVILLIMLTYELIRRHVYKSACTMRRPTKVGVLLSNVNNSYLSSIQKALEDIQRENIDKVQFTFYDSNDNQSIQETTINNLIQGRKVDFLLANLVNKRAD